MVAAHYFSNTNEAYDACQIGETDGGVRVEMGDILIIHSELVVGVCDTWPIAVTPVHGALHKVDNWEEYNASVSPEYLSRVLDAILIARDAKYL